MIYVAHVYACMVTTVRQESMPLQMSETGENDLLATTDATAATKCQIKSFTE